MQDDLYSVLREIRDNAEKWCQGREDTVECKASAQWVQGFDQTRVPAMAPPAGTEAEDEFARTISQLTSATHCLTEEALKRPGEDHSEIIEAESNRISMLRNKLSSLVRGIANNAAQAQAELAHHQEPDKDEDDNENIDHSEQASNENEEAGHSQTIHTDETSGKHQAHARNAASLAALNSAAAKQQASHAYAKLYYTRLVFWLVITAMVILLVVHLAMGGSANLAVTAGGIILLLFVLYYLIQFGYRKYF